MVIAEVVCNGVAEVRLMVISAGVFDPTAADRLSVRIVWIWALVEMWSDVWWFRTSFARYLVKIVQRQQNVEGRLAFADQCATCRNIWTLVVRWIWSYVGFSEPCVTYRD